MSFARPPVSPPALSPSVEVRVKVLSSKSRSAARVALNGAAVILVAVVLAGTGSLAGVAQAAALSPVQAQAAADHRARVQRDLGRKARAARAAAARKARIARDRRHLLRTAGAKKVSRALPQGWRSAKVSWYGPGFYGRGMAGGGKLKVTSMVVAHKTLPFGTRVQFWYDGKSIIVPVQDRGPYVAGREFDLGPGPAVALGIDKMGVATLQYRILGR
jgi:rare lipoprotein A (peptidoglycan hydrolase)